MTLRPPAPAARTTRPRPRDLRRRLRLRARAPRLSAGRRVRARGRARASGGRCTQLHRDFVHAGSDVVEALTYYAHREKLRVIGREQDLEPINRRALDAREGGRAGDRRAVRRRHLQHQHLRSGRRGIAQGGARDVRGAGAAGRSTPASTSSSARRSRYAQEALIALDVDQAGGAGRGDHARDAQGGRHARGLDASPTRASASRTPAPTSSGSIAFAARRR